MIGLVIVGFVNTHASAVSAIDLSCARPTASNFSRTSKARGFSINSLIRALFSPREPDGAATIALKLGVYRKLDPGALEEMLFFDHPSGRTRIMAAMRWKAEHLGTGGT